MRLIGRIYICGNITKKYKILIKMVPDIKNYFFESKFRVVKDKRPDRFKTLSYFLQV